MINQYLQTYILGGKKIYKNVLYPEVPLNDEDKYIISTQGDRLDRLSDEFYNTTDYWWIISIANNLSKSSLYVPAGTQLRIPFPIDIVLLEFEQLNQE